MSIVSDRVLRDRFVAGINDNTLRLRLKDFVRSSPGITFRAARERALDDLEVTEDSARVAAVTSSTTVSKPWAADLGVLECCLEHKFRKCET